MASHLKTSQAEYTDIYAYEPLLRTSRQVPPNTPTLPSPTIGIGSAHAPKYHDFLDPRSHKSPALSRPPPQASSRPPRRNAPATYPYVAPPVRDWPSRDPIGERGGTNLYGMVGNRMINTFDILGLVPPEVWLNGEDPSPPPPPEPSKPMGEPTATAHVAASLGLMGDEPNFGTENWYEKRFPELLAEAKKRAVEKLIKLAKFRRCSEGKFIVEKDSLDQVLMSVYPRNNLGKGKAEEIQGVNNWVFDDQFGDKTQSGWEYFALLGAHHFRFEQADAPIIFLRTENHFWDNDVKNYYEVKSRLELRDNLGHAIIGANKKVTLASWSIRGEFWCSCKKDRYW